jgi:acetoin utilization deacetylase AcuC-like enzyme
VFCAVRPPGHHAGPHGIVTNGNDPRGSHGFCLINNVAVGAAYAMSLYRYRGVRRVAILDFDVHHGNGTEACVANTVPSQSTRTYTTPFGDGVEAYHHWRPWLDGEDRRNILFASVHGFGRRTKHSPAHIYPGSGATCDTAEVRFRRSAACKQAQREVSALTGVW